MGYTRSGALFNQQVLVDDAQYLNLPLGLKGFRALVVELLALPSDCKLELVQRDELLLADVEGDLALKGAQVGGGDVQVWVVGEHEVGEQLRGVLLGPGGDVFFGPVPLVDVSSLSTLVLDDAANDVVGFSHLDNASAVWWQ